MNDEIDPKEEALQERLDAGLSTAENFDAHAYRTLYAGLSNPPARLSSSFAYDAMVRVWRHRRKQDVRDPLLSLFLSAAAIAAGLASLYAVSSLGFGPRFDWQSILNGLAPVRYAAPVILLLAIVDAIISRFPIFRK